jgi:hypothetical protein
MSAGGQRDPETSRRPPGTREALIALDGAMGLNALAGAWYGLAGASAVPREWLAGTPFRTYRAPAAVLGVAVGGSQLAAAAALARRTPRAPARSAVAAVVLLGWIGAQVAAIGYRSPLQPAVVAWGAAALVLSLRLRSAEGRETALRVAGWPQRRTPASPRAVADRASES